MKYQQLTEGDRYMIVALKWQGLSFTDIATAIGKHRSTIYLEFQRNTCWRMAHIDPSGHSKGQELDVDAQGETNILQKRITYH
ncbi:MAG: helix-turn-helix domain-containing protein [Candidatus Endonucleobacter sp. (ex Gigantidas childressi)]|nr:helix-turn-helix domain-containing protein [Candidatus Endonucleobacter sp. (ex Gigantidas childressi)]